MTRLCRRLTMVTVGVLGLLSLSSRTSATTIDPLTWEQLVLQADFVGVVQCDVAGGVVAKYRVVESYKGPPAGTQLAIRVAVDYWEPQFPVALCGQQCFVTAFQSPPTRIRSISWGGGVPLWWRRISADYQLPLFQGRVALREMEFLRPQIAFGNRHEKFAVFRQEVESLLAADPNKQEARVLKSIASKYIHVPPSTPDKPLKSQIDALLRQIVATASAEDIIALLVQLGQENAEMWGRPVLRILEQGGPITLHQMEQLAAEKRPWKQEEHTLLLKSLRRRLAPDKTEPGLPPDVKNEPPEANKLQRLRAVFAAERPAEQAKFHEALRTLTTHDPGPVARYLLAWTNPERDWRSADDGYELGSLFGAFCGVDRATHFQTLLKAKDSYIRTAAAVYLAIEDEQKGVAALQQMAQLADDPGAWAALNLARRGHKSAVPRALKVFKARGEENMSGVPHRNLQRRVLVLLSNVARQCELPQPWSRPESDDNDRKFNSHEHLSLWWEEHADRASLKDPWLETLVKQKID